MPDTLVIVPTYNEKESLPIIITRLRQAVPAAHILIVDDSSPDGTGELADRIAADEPDIGVLHRPKREGLGRAYLEGFQYGMDRGYKYLIEIDADGSHDPADLAAMQQIAVDGADLVLGSRWVPGGDVVNWPWLRRTISRIGNAYARAVLGSAIHDLTSGFRVFTTESLRGIRLEHIASQGYCFQIELAWTMERSGHTVVEHPITFVERALGQSKMHFGIVLEALARVTVWGLTRRRR